MEDSETRVKIRESEIRVSKTYSKIFPIKRAGPHRNLNMQMDIQVRIGIITSHSFCFRSTKQNSSPPPSSSSSSSSPYSPYKPLCSRRGSQQPQQNGDGNSNNNNKGGDKYSTDWDKAWSSFRKQGKKTLFSEFSPNKYVTWNPRRSNYPPSEEVDPIKRTERSNLMLWTSPRFTLAGAILIVTFLLVYTILYPVRLLGERNRTSTSYDIQQLHPKAHEQQLLQMMSRVMEIANQKLQSEPMIAKWSAQALHISVLNGYEYVLKMQLKEHARRAQQPSIRLP